MDRWQRYLPGFFDFFEGDVNFPAVITAIATVGYEGNGVAEIFARTDYSEALFRRIGADMQAMATAASKISPSA
jgi:sugar phosphate isomerase/epimerase